MRLAFSVFDDDGDGRITKEEMDRYLTAFFKVCFDLSARMQQGFRGVSSRDLGAATAAHCFREADRDGDGKVSFEEFKRWYSEQPNQTIFDGAEAAVEAASPIRPQSASYGPIIPTRAAGRSHHRVPMPYVAHRKKKTSARDANHDAAEANGNSLQTGTKNDNEDENDDEDADEEEEDEDDEEEKMMTGELRRRWTQQRNDAGAGVIAASEEEDAPTFASKQPSAPRPDLAATSSSSSSIRRRSEEAIGLRPPTRRRGDVVDAREDEN